MAASSSDPRTVGGWQRRLVLAMAIVAVLHSIMLVFWLAPPGPVRDVVGEKRLAAYVNPYFDQSWGALSPNAQFVDESFRFRAHVEDEETGEDRVTEWIDVTDTDLAAQRHDLSPARVHLMARRLATNLNGVMYEFTSAQRKLVQTNYISTPITTLGSRLLGGGKPEAVRTYLAYDQMATRFASMYAASMFDEKILEVQYLIGRRSVPAYDNRGDQSVRDAEYDWFAFGYRRAYQASFEAQVAFDDYVGR